MRAAATGVFLAISLFGQALAGDVEVVGRASIVDGDTIEIQGQRIRFHGVDAPESRQTCQDANGRKYRCGQAATFALDDFLAASRPTRCVKVGWHRKRTVADCYRADGQSVAAWLVRNGHALDWPRYSKGRYADEHRAARAARSGIWQGQFVEPWEWRKGVR